MKPKPFWALNHFTVPVVMGDPFTSRSMLPTRNLFTGGGQAVEFAIVFGSKFLASGHFYARRQSSSVYRPPAYGRLPLAWQGPPPGFPGWAAGCRNRAPS